jgi:hypothetical protein
VLPRAPAWSLILPVGVSCRHPERRPASYEDERSDNTPGTRRRDLLLT